MRRRLGRLVCSRFAGEVSVRRGFVFGVVEPVLIAVMLAAPRPTTVAGAQTPPASQMSQMSHAAPMGRDEIAAFAKVQVAISQAHDSIDAQLAQSRNKTAQAQ